MRHLKANRKFGRTPAHRRAMFRNMATSLLEHGSIETTLPKAKDLRRVVERLITLGGEDSLHRRRRALSYITDKKVVHQLFAEIGPRFKDRPGGYTRILKTRVRAGDAAPMAIIQLVEEEFKAKAKKKTRAKAKSKTKVEAQAPVDAVVETEVQETASEAKADE
ncbi:MAG: 50S ribosomal protein L17 [Bdellovibrionales bacterium]|nr:50S ribosomal protein L17 [Bdellovibrionales bacterium]